MCHCWFIERNTLLDDKAKAQKLISAEIRQMWAFQLKMCVLQSKVQAFHVEMHKIADFGDWLLKAEL